MKGARSSALRILPVVLDYLTDQHLHVGQVQGVPGGQGCGGQGNSGGGQGSVGSSGGDGQGSGSGQT